MRIELYGWKSLITISSTHYKNYINKHYVL